MHYGTYTGLNNFNTYSKIKQLKFTDPYSARLTCRQLMFFSKRE